MSQCSEVDKRIMEGMASLFPQRPKINPVIGIDTESNCLIPSSRAWSTEEDNYLSVKQDAAHVEKAESIWVWSCLRDVAESFAENYAKELAPEDDVAFKPIPVDPNTNNDDCFDDGDTSSESSAIEDERQPVFSALVTCAENALKSTVTKTSHGLVQQYMTAKPTTIPEFSRRREKNVVASSNAFGPESTPSPAETCTSLEVTTDIYRQYALDKEAIEKFEFARILEKDFNSFVTRIDSQLASINALDSCKVSEQLKEIHDAMQLKGAQLKELDRLLCEGTLDQKKRGKRLEVNVYHEHPSPFQHSYVNDLDKNRLNVYYDAVQIMDEYDRLLAAEEITDTERKTLMAEKSEVWRELRQWASNDSKNIATRTAKTYSYFFRTPRVALFTT
ncbi:hypothetical protein V1517DRAFT_132115 [Lipomyces orientalis]|uniref:Uncharacterized protein n=1 Tax=Lipomyces orientalis TaxID=1233043 RepID=A0ACC3TPQ3_9ASCO